MIQYIIMINKMKGYRTLIWLQRSFGKKGYFGSQKTLAKKICISDRTLRNHLSKLLKEGIIVEKKNDGFDTKRLCINEKNKNITIYKSDKNIFDMFFEDEN